MKLPLFDEVHRARALAEEADEATGLCFEAGSALIALSALELQLRAGVDRFDDLGAVGEIIERALDRFSDLAGLRGLEPPPGASPARHLELRRQQLVALQQRMAPIADQHRARAGLVHQLAQRQAQHLRNPRYAELNAELRQRHRERGRLQAAMVDLRNRLAAIGPAAQALERTLPLVAADLADRGDAGPTWARARVGAIGGAIDGAGPEVSAAIGLFGAEELVRGAELDEALGRIRELSAELSAERDGLAEELAELQAGFEEATRWIRERTG